VEKEKTSKPEKSWSAVSLAWQLGYTIAVPLVLFALAGRFLDRKFGTTPWLLLAGIILAIASTTWLIWKKTKELIDSEQ